MICFYLITTVASSWLTSGHGFLGPARTRGFIQFWRIFQYCRNRGDQVCQVSRLRCSSILNISATISFRLTLKNTRLAISSNYKIYAFVNRACHTASDTIWYYQGSSDPASKSRRHFWYKTASQMIISPEWSLKCNGCVDGFDVEGRWIDVNGNEHKGNPYAHPASSQSSWRQSRWLVQASATVPMLLVQFSNLETSDQYCVSPHAMNSPTSMTAIFTWADMQTTR